MGGEGKGELVHSMASEVCMDKSMCKIWTAGSPVTLSASKKAKSPKGQKAGGAQTAKEAAVECM